MCPRLPALVTALTLLVSSAVQNVHAAVGVSASNTNPGSVTMTLITGDRVIVAPASSGVVSVQPATGREHIAFRLEHEISAADGKLHTFVKPIDAAPLIATGKLDRGCST